MFENPEKPSDPKSPGNERDTDIGSTSGSDLIGDEVGKEVGAVAAQAVRILDVREFIQHQMPTLHDKLVECEEYAQSADLNDDMMFVALSLPIINGVIHIASDGRHLREAKEWVVSRWKGEGNKEPDPVSILSALTLIYVVVEGWRLYKDDPEKKELWESILNRVKILSSEIKDEEIA